MAITELSTVWHLDPDYGERMIRFNYSPWNSCEPEGKLLSSHLIYTSQFRLICFSGETTLMKRLPQVGLVSQILAKAQYKVSLVEQNIAWKWKVDGVEQYTIYILWWKKISTMHYEQVILFILPQWSLGRYWNQLVCQSVCRQLFPAT